MIKEKDTLKLQTVRVKPKPCLRDKNELFEVGRYRPWKKGQISNPRWMKRENGFDFISLNTEGDMVDFEKYLARVDSRLCVEDYNSFTTGCDKAGAPMIVLSETFSDGNFLKKAIIICNNPALAIPAVELVEHFCGTEEFANA